MRLYNVLFPVWLLWLFPQIFLIVAPANLLVDCLVLTLALMGLKHKNKRAMKECELLTQREKHVVALTMAIVTAPWLFFIPLYWY